MHKAEGGGDSVIIVHLGRSTNLLLLLIDTGRDRNQRNKFHIHSCFSDTHAPRVGVDTAYPVGQTSFSKWRRGTSTPSVRFKDDADGRNPSFAPNNG